MTEKSSFTLIYAIERDGSIFESPPLYTEARRVELPRGLHVCPGQDRLSSDREAERGEGRCRINTGSKTPVRTPEVAGTIVYSLSGHDYGLAADDTRFSGIPHTSVTLDPTGDYPSFTIQTADLEEITDPAPLPR